MKLFAHLAAAAVGWSGLAMAATIDFPSGLKNLTTTDSYHMKTVRVVQARVQSDKPKWNADNGAFVSTYYDDFNEGFRGLLDTVNTASVEGALMYVQAEGINAATQSTKCQRKNNMKYVVFYDMVITQTNETLAQYNSEYGTYVAMDGGQCTPTSGSGNSATFPDECYYFNGTNGKPNLGPFVGGEARDTDARAPYPDTWWYSFPNTCPLQKWADKTDECRSSTRGGLCAFDTKPDGVNCTFNYRVLGWMPIDDLVGITAMSSETTGKPYTNFSEFCNDGKVEFNGTTNGSWLSGIDFWKDPQDKDANAARATQLVSMYNNALSSNGNTTLTQVAASDLANFQALPTVEALRTENPPCYNNVAECATATYGCKRSLYGQICTACTAKEDECVVAPSGFTFPTLAKAKATAATVAPSSSSSSSSSTDSSSNTPEAITAPSSTGTPESTSAPESASTPSSAAAASVVMLSYAVAVAVVAASYVL